jgi:hypothetical protein
LGSVARSTSLEAGSAANAGRLEAVKIGTRVAARAVRTMRAMDRVTKRPLLI